LFGICKHDQHENRDWKAATSADSDSYDDDDDDDDDTAEADSRVTHVTET